MTRVGFVGKSHSNRGIENQIFNAKESVVIRFNERGPLAEPEGRRQVVLCLYTNLKPTTVAQKWSRVGHSYAVNVINNIY